MLGEDPGQGSFERPNVSESSTLVITFREHSVMATPSRSSQALANRERARTARLALDVERIKRDELIEATAAEVFNDLDSVAQLREQLDALDKSIGARIDVLVHDARLSVKDVGTLLGMDQAEVKRLRTAPAKGAKASDSDPRDGSENN